MKKLFLIFLMAFASFFIFANDFVLPFGLSFDYNYRETRIALHNAGFNEAHVWIFEEWENPDAIWEGLEVRNISLLFERMYDQFAPDRALLSLELCFSLLSDTDKYWQAVEKYKQLLMLVETEKHIDKQRTKITYKSLLCPYILMQINYHEFFDKEFRYISFIKDR